MLARGTSVAGRENPVRTSRSEIPPLAHRRTARESRTHGPERRLCRSTGETLRAGCSCASDGKRRSLDRRLSNG
uniref:Uncharacterized protein n=1 Tax=Tanacetum cinerariifolium TaxID=118510 RepID=A0A699XDI3_TANCI|nr:hypothetical protein [Tanacetum cinerariifolium]